MNLVAAAAFACAPRSDRVRLGLEIVLQGLEPLRLTAGRVRERLREHPIGEPRVAGEQRAVEIRSDNSPDTATLEAGLPVVPESRDDPAERVRARV